METKKFSMERYLRATSFFFFFGDIMQEEYTIGEAAKILKVTTKTLRNWDRDGHEGMLVPHRLVNGERRYSRKDIEKHIGCTIEETIDPILYLGQDDINGLMWLNEEVATCSFNVEECKSVRDAVQRLYVHLINQSTRMYRLTKKSSANWIIASPEFAALFECGWPQFAPGISTEEESASQICYQGTISMRWKLYATPLLDADTAIMGMKLDNKIEKTPEAVKVIKISDWLVGLYH